MPETGNGGLPYAFTLIGGLFLLAFARVFGHERRITEVETHIKHIRESQERVEGKLDSVLERE